MEYTVGVILAIGGIGVGYFTFRSKADWSIRLIPLAVLAIGAAFLIQKNWMDILVSIYMGFTVLFWLIFDLIIPIMKKRKK